LLPFEFVVTGSPISLQTNNRALLQSWKTKVRQAAVSRLPVGIPTIQSVQLIVIHYYTASPPDIDNIAKPILDALNLLVYIDDKQITDLTLRKRNLRNLSKAQNLPEVIAEALAKGEPFVYVKIDKSPNLTELTL
jgi:hypothetical protein